MSTRSMLDPPRRMMRMNGPKLATVNAILKLPTRSVPLICQNVSQGQPMSANVKKGQFISRVENPTVSKKCFGSMSSNLTRASTTLTHGRDVDSPSGQGSDRTALRKGGLILESRTGI
eukprot:487333-Prorocentrum_minimum.AAC.1